MAATHAIEGTLTLYSANFARPTGTGCAGTGGYADIRVGTQVTVMDAEGRLIGVGTLGDGRDSSASGGCECALAVRDVPEVNFYRVEGSRRGMLAY